MSIEGLTLATKVVLPLLADVGTLFSNLLSGARSLATGKAELRSIVAVALDRLDSAEAADKERDAAEDKRVSALADDLNRDV